MVRARRRVAVAAVVSAAALTVTTVVAAEAAPSRFSSQRIDNVIYLLGDGMGRTHVTAGRDRFYGASGSLNMERLPVVGQVRTYAVQENSGQPGEADFEPEYVTDSASSATAWASGVKTYNAALGVDAKAAVVPTVMEQAKDEGYRTGNVSTAEITDATPASQVSHVLLRGCQGPSYSATTCQNTAVTGGVALPTSDVRVTPVAEQIARNGTADVILGGGLSRFDAADEKALLAQGYDVLGSPTTQTVATRSDLAGARSGKVFGLFNRGNLTIEKFKQENPKAPQAAEPTLPEMTRKAISLLHRNRGKGFFLQVEGALIDKRSHANDAAQTLEEIKAFDDAVQVAVDFARRDQHTLVIVTADHECAGFAIVEKGTFTNAEATTPPNNVDTGNTANSTTSPVRSAQAKDPRRSTGPQNGSGPRDAANFAPATFRTADDPASVKDGSPDASLWLTYLSGNHTGEDVPLFAYGPRSGALAGTVENTDLHDVMAGALRLDRS
jgi:alkaline phosphatase